MKTAPQAPDKFLIAFINSILADSVGTIEDLTYLNTEQLGENPKEKKMVYDIYCTTSDKEHIIVELQVGGQSYFGNVAISGHCLEGNIWVTRD